MIHCICKEASTRAKLILCCSTVASTGAAVWRAKVAWADIRSNAMVQLL